MAVEDVTFRLIRAYFDCVQEFTTKLCTHYKVTDIWEGRKRGVIPRRANLENISYFFHGVGCTAEISNLELSFDLTATGEINGIDAWFLFKFLRGNMEAFPPLKSFDDLKKGLEILKQQGVIVSSNRPNDHLMYFSETR